MNYEIVQPGAFAILKVKLAAGESIKAESDAMVAMSKNIKLEGKMEGGFLGGLARKFLSGESLFFQTLTAQHSEGEVMLAPAAPGDIECIELDGSTGITLQSGAFLAAEQSINVETKMQNLMTGIFSGAGLFVVKVKGKGNLFVNAFGALHAVVLSPGQEWVVDTGHLVAWEDTVQYEIGKASEGFLSSMTSGEFLVCKMRGPGLVIIQSRNPNNFGQWVHPLLPPSNN